jgi:hypothetical protein
MNLIAEVANFTQGIDLNAKERVMKVQKIQKKNTNFEVLSEVIVFFYD